jgi:hypothetical protein
MLTLSRQVGSKTSVNTHHAGEEDLMTLQLGAVAPDFEAEITQGRIRFHEWIGDAWCLLFSHPKDFTPVCTTELGCMARIKPEFDRRNPIDSPTSGRNPGELAAGTGRDHCRLCVG